MKLNGFTLAAIGLVFVAACHTTKKTNTPVATQPVNPPATVTTATSNATAMATKRPANGIYEPGSTELTAIQTTYANASMAQLMEGYHLYTAGACVKCHEAKNIYRRGNNEWKGIIDEMADKAHINDVQKDAVYKYVMSIKATQPK